MRWQVELKSGGAWRNPWRDDATGKPLTFATKAAATAALTELVRDAGAATSAITGGYDWRKFRIVRVPRHGA